MFSLKNKIFIEHILIAILLVCLWSLTHIFTLGWGLPNPMSFAIDTIPPQRNMSAFDMMHHENMQYPPLQYLIVSYLVEKRDEPAQLSEELVQLRSDKIFMMRLTTAIMSLVSALAISFFIYHIFGSITAAFIAGFCFICNPLSLYYSHTSNMDQPYLMWWILSIIAVFLADRSAEKAKKISFLIWNCLAGILFGLSFCTKDQVYALYAIPLLAYLVFLFFRKRCVEFPINALFIWIISFILTASLVYWLIGGWSVFLTHIRWISNSEHQILYAQCENGFFNRLRFVLKSLFDLAKCLDIPVLVFCAISFPLICLSFKKTDEKNKYKVLLIFIFLLLTLISMQLFFIQVTRFSFPRYYLPILPLVSCLIASLFIVLRVKYKGVVYLLTLFLLVYQALLAWQFLNSIQNDSRMQIRKLIEYISFSNSLKNPKIGLSGVTNFRKVAFRFDSRSNAVLRKMTLVNEPLPTFGFLSERQKSIEQKYSSLVLFSPEIIVNSGQPSKTWTDILYASGYELITTISPKRLNIPALFRHESPRFEIFISTSQRDINQNILIQEYSSRSFEENLMSLANSIDIAQINRQIQIVGRYFPAFTPPDINNNHIKIVILDFLADAYEFAGRLEDSAKTRIFILKNTNDENLISRSLSFFSRHNDYKIER